MGRRHIQHCPSRKACPFSLCDLVRSSRHLHTLVYSGLAFKSAFGGVDSALYSPPTAGNLHLIARFNCSVVANHGYL